jgi:hypothetical protein
MKAIALFLRHCLVGLLLLLFSLSGSAQQAATPPVCADLQFVSGHSALRREGHFIQNIWFKGKWGDEYLYAILKEEWLGKRAQ